MVPPNIFLKEQGCLRTDAALDGTPKRPGPNETEA